MTKKLRKEIIRISIGFAITMIAVLASQWNEWVGLGLYLVAYFVTGYDVVKGAFSNIIHGHFFDENFLMTLATVGAFACQEYLEAVAVMLFYQVGECFQSYAVNKSRKSIKALMNIRPDYAIVIRDGVEVRVDPSEVKIGETILVSPGEKIPLDGTVINGESSIDTAAITGESLPRDVATSDLVVSGCVNLTGRITVCVTSEYGESTVSKILQLVEDASSKKAQAEKFITVFARWYTPIVVISALLVAIIGPIITGDAIMSWVYRAMTFLLISCPCALVISVPLSFFGGIGGAGKRGILIKGGNYMESLSKINVLVLDKTGTITKGNFAIAKIHCSQSFQGRYGEKSSSVLMEKAAMAEVYSSHPIALSILSEYGREVDKERIVDISEIAGKGVKALIDSDTIYVGNARLMSDVLSKEELDTIDEGIKDTEAGTVVYIAENDHFAGRIRIEDECKDHVKEALEDCRHSGIQKIVMLTGDNEKTAAAVASKVGVDEIHANLTPLDKVTVLEEILKQNEGGKTAFAGDGINDAPVLVRADVGIAMGAMGSDAAIEAADVVIMTDELERIAEAKRIAKKTIRIVKENIIFALVVKVMILVLATLGLVTMWAAIFADVGVAFLAILNSMRALGKKQKQA